MPSEDTIATIVCAPQHLRTRAHLVDAARAPGRALAIGDLRLEPGDALDCGAPLGTVAVADLLATLLAFDDLTGGSCPTPLDAGLYRLTGATSLLERYFPVVLSLDSAGRAAFYQQVLRVGLHPGLDLHLQGEDGRDHSQHVPADARALVAGQLVELFLYRPELLEAILAAPRHIWLYTTPRAFVQDGGVAGGDYDPATGRLQLVLARLYEGYFGELPGVAPFIHELGHLLDDLTLDEVGPVAPDVGHVPRRREAATGLPPGLRHADGPLYSPEARSRFLRGKQLEAARYRRCCAGDNTDPPVGHPYVFQTDGEFLAGYLELFLRTPHYFARRNPLLFSAFTLLFRQDPRRARARDFAFYVEENQRAYAPGNGPLSDPGLTLAAV
jgi:hypothetical protein